MSPSASSTAWQRARQRAELQGGTIDHPQLLDAGLSATGIRRKLHAGLLFPRHEGVYALGRATLSPFGETWAAALAGGDRGAVTGRSALAVRGHVPWPPVPELLVRGGRLELEGVRLFRTRRVEAHEVEVNPQGLRATAMPRTLTTLAATHSIAELQAVLDVVERGGHLDLLALDAAIADARGRPGMRKLRSALLPFRVPADDHRSLLERFADVLVREGGLPLPEINGPIEIPGEHGITADLVYRALRLAIELDGRESHTTAHQFWLDRQRDRLLMRHGWRVLRFTWLDVVYRPAIAIEEIRAFVPAAAA